MSSVGGIQRCGCNTPEPAYQTQAQVQARASYRERSTQTAGALSVRTDDGDVVNISFASLTSQSVGRYSATDGTNRVQGVERSSSSAYAVEVSVEGTLDDEEVEDIRKLLSKLASQVQNPNPRRIEKQFDKLDSLESFEFGFEQTVTASFERAEVIERPSPQVLPPEPLPATAPVDAPIVTEPNPEPAETANPERIETAPPDTSTEVPPAPAAVDSETADFQTLLTRFSVSASDATLRSIEAQFEQIRSIESGFEQTETASFERIDIAA